MTDRIEIKDLHVRTIVGIRKEERENRQDVLINITLWVDTRAAARSDRIEDTVNYRTITKRVLALADRSRYFLVEKLAEEISRIALQDPRVGKARVAVEKPGALRFARSVGVVIERSQRDAAETPHRAFLSLGSNLEPETHLPAAVDALGGLGKVRGLSGVWETAPADGSDQPNYLNMAVLLETAHSARVLLDNLLEVEARLGRVRDPADKFAARTIDIDLSLFDEEVLQLGHRRVPDPDIEARVFVAVPLAELDPGYVHPVSQDTLAEIAGRLRAGNAIKARPDVEARLGTIVD